MAVTVRVVVAAAGGGGPVAAGVRNTRDGEGGAA